MSAVKINIQFKLKKKNYLYKKILEKLIGEI